jgi:preprotein translocase subunit SecB
VRQLANYGNLTTESTEMADEPKGDNGDATAKMAEATAAGAPAGATPGTATGATPGATPPEPVKSPKVELAVDLQTHRAAEPGQYEIVLKMRVTAVDETVTMFIVELAYAAYVILKDVPEDYIQQVLMIEIPRQIFPFARRIVSDVTRDGGMMPLMLEPIDFLAIYRKKMAEAAGQAPPAS